MRKCFYLLYVIGLLICGCSNNNETINNNELKKLKQAIDNNNELIQELSKKNKELENKIAILEEEKEGLNEEIKTLQESDKTINSNIDSKYNELKTLINNKPTTTGNQYTITKEQLLGTWENIGWNNSETFTNENTEIIGNWIIYKGNMTLHYMYKDGKLYVTDDGWIMKKQ